MVLFFFFFFKQILLTRRNLTAHVCFQVRENGISGGGGVK